MLLYLHAPMRPTSASCTHRMVMSIITSNHRDVPIFRHSGMDAAGWWLPMLHPLSIAGLMAIAHYACKLF